ncbi:MAG TPA: DUF433 domain-containing protein [Flavipsychrobacter sp.]|nr:DUF433 domain-containing protein [Flavipsychrobacter sp.]
MSNEEISKLVSRITSNPGIFGGRPIIRGMRFPVADVLELLACGMTAEQIIEEHPILEKEDIQAALYYAALRLKNVVFVHAA